MSDICLDIRARTLSDVIETLVRNPGIKHLRIRMGFRFWSESPLCVIYEHDHEYKQCKPSREKENDLQEFAEIIGEHPSLESITLIGPSLASLYVLCNILKGITQSKTMNTLSIPIIPLERFTNNYEKKMIIKLMLQYLRNSQNIIHIHVTNGINDTFKGFNYVDDYTDTKETSRLNNIFKTIMIHASAKRKRMSKL